MALVAALYAWNFTSSRSLENPVQRAALTVQAHLDGEDGKGGKDCEVGKDGEDSSVCIRVHQWFYRSSAASGQNKERPPLSDGRSLACIPLTRRSPWPRSH